MVLLGEALTGSVSLIPFSFIRGGFYGWVHDVSGGLVGGLSGSGLFCLYYSVSVRGA